MELAAELVVVVAELVVVAVELVVVVAELVAEADFTQRAHKREGGRWATRRVELNQPWRCITLG